jgi:hypothetical protein
MGASVARPVLIEGFTADEVLALTNDQLSQFVFCDQPVVFRIGSAEILGKFERNADSLILEADDFRQVEPHDDHHHYRL